MERPARIIGALASVRSVPLVISVGLFISGIFRRVLYWLPPLLLDSEDAARVYAKYIRPYLPAPAAGLVDWLMGHALIAFGLLLAWAAVLTYHELRMTSAGRIASLERKLTLGVELPDALQMFRPSAAEPIEAQGWMLYLQAARITNRSATTSVSLGLTIHVRLLENARSLSRLSIREESDLGLMKAHLPPRGPQYLQCPLNIPPERTVQGMLGFWVSPGIEQVLGVEQLDKIIARRGDPRYGVRDAELEIVDYISGEVLTVPVPSAGSISAAVVKALSSGADTGAPTQ